MNFKAIRTEKIIFILMVALVIILNAGPYVYQSFYCQYADKVYIASYPVIPDKFAYMTEMTQGEEGNWKLIDKFTTEPQEGAYIYLPYIFLGHAARELKLPVETVFFISRFIFGMIFLFTVIKFIRYFVPDEKKRLWAYFFAFFATGLGWITANRNSPDFWLPEAIPITRFSYFPHFMIANTLLLISVLMIYRSFKENNPRLALVAGISTFLMNFALTFNTALLYPVIILFTAIIGLKDKTFIRKNLKNILIFFAVSLPSFLYMYYLGTHDPIWQAVEKENVLPVSSLPNLLSGYGLTLIFSICGLRFLYKEDRFKGLFFLVWMISAFLLAHIPTSIYPMQRRFLETAFFVPLAITAGFGLMGIYNYYKNKNISEFDLKSKAIFALFIAPFLLVGNIQSLADFKYYITATNVTSLYLSSDNVEAIKWLRGNSPKESIVLAAPDNGIAVPYFGDRFTYEGPGPLNLNSYAKRAKVYDFYSMKYSSTETYEFLKKEKINYIFYSDSEKGIGSFDPSKYDFLEKVYQNKKAGIYKTKITE